MQRPKLSRKQITILLCALMVATAVIAAVFYYVWIDFQTHYLGIMKELNTSETKTYMRNKINGTRTAVELLTWTNQNLNWSDEDFVRYSKPQEILNQGKGRCEEFTIVYVAACLSLGYESRIVVSRQFYQIFNYAFHVWAEVKLDGVWIQFDPSPTPFWNNTSRYKSWDWGPRNTLSVFAFEDGKMEDVTSRYR